MNIPIEIIVLTGTIIVMAAGGLISILVKAMANNTEAIRDIKEWMVAKDTSDKYESNECLTQHTYIKKKLEDIYVKINEHEKRLTIIENEKVKRTAKSQNT